MASAFFRRDEEDWFFRKDQQANLVAIVESAEADDCGCFGGGGQVAPGEADYLTPLLRDTGLTLLAIYLTLFPHTKFGLDKKPKSVTEQGEGNNG